MKTLGFVSQLNGQNVVMTLSVIWHICIDVFAIHISN